MLHELSGNRLIFIGHPGSQGVYLLRIMLARSVSLIFGRFANGRCFTLPVGDYLYIGSALGKRGSTTLPGRLLRHATRSNEQIPHAIRTDLSHHFQSHNVPATLPKTKRCRWHIDYLLDQSDVVLCQIYGIYTTASVEAQLARWLMADAATTTVVPGLGASDDPGATHLLHVNVPSTWWEQLPAKLSEEIYDPTTHSR